MNLNFIRQNGRQIFRYGLIVFYIYCIFKTGQIMTKGAISVMALVILASFLISLLFLKRNKPRPRNKLAVFNACLQTAIGFSLLLYTLFFSNNHELALILYTSAAVILTISIASCYYHLNLDHEIHDQSKLN